MVGRRCRFGLAGGPAPVRLGSLALLVIFAVGPAQAATYTVTSAANTGGGSLRTAITNANASVGVPDTIVFNLPGPDYTIDLTAALPPITDRVSIDGNTQPGYAGIPLVEVNGAGAPGADGFVLNVGASGSTIRALAINRFGSGRAAIRIQGGSSGNLVAGCHLGTDLGGTVARPNGIGVIIDASPNNTIGGTGTSPPDRNIISANAVDGMQIYGNAADNNVVLGNHIGVDASGTADLGNASQGVAVFVSADNNTIGGTAAGAGNVISGNGNDGVLIADSGTTGNLVQGNRIGTNAAGTAAIPNVRGVEITNLASGNTIGGTVASAANLISGNASNGILLVASTNTVQRNSIGTDVSGTLDLGNGQHGIQIIAGASSNLIGGASGDGNVISGNNLNGVDILHSGTSGNRVAGNIIGLDVTGTVDLGNTDFGVAIAQGASGNIIGEVGGGNVISGNDKAGVRIVDNSSNNNVLQLNYIGLDVTGMLPRPNAAEGVVLDASVGASGNTIGGVGVGNVISGNGTVGVRILNRMTATTVAANIIGRNVADGANVPNGGGGVRIESSSGNTIGGTAAFAGNVIAGNSGSDGVAVVGATATGNAILGNSIFANAGLGIDLGDDGVNANDDGDADTGPNGLQNTAVLSAVVTNGARAHVAGSFSGPVAGVYRVEFFGHAIAAADPTGSGEGRYYLGSQSVTTDANGYGLIATTLTAAVAASVDYIAATVTDPSNNTSEFSRNGAASGDLIVTTTDDAADAPDTSSVAALIANNGADGRISLREAITATNNSAGTDTIRFGIPLTDGNHVYYQDDLAPGLSIVATTPRADTAITNFDTDYPPGMARGWYRIRPASALPAINEPVVLDGTTQSGHITGAPVIELDGSLAGAGVDGLQITSNGNAVRGLVINRFGHTGIEVISASGNLIAGNYLGTDVSGTLDLGNNNDGVRLRDSATANTVGGTSAADRNVLSGNDDVGVTVFNSSIGNVVLGNYIGTDVTGTRALGNRLQGIVVWDNSNNNTIGGLSAGAGNVIAGASLFSGVLIYTSNDNLLQGNYIGTNATGTASLPNAGVGVELVDSANCTIGGTAAGARNVISGNTSYGVEIRGAPATGNQVLGNYIGTDAVGTAGISNGAPGVSIGVSAANNAIGGKAAGAGNTIAFNGAAGIGVQSTAGTGNSILGNAVHSNGALGIDLGEDGVTANDPLDADTGPNDLLNFPSFPAPVESVAGTLSVTYGLDVPAGWYRVEFFKNPAGADGSGNGEGQEFVSSVVVWHPGGGTEVYSHSFAGVVGDVISATTTFCLDGTVDCSLPRSTSEFSRAWAAVPTVVRLMSFTATGGDESVLLEWQTGSELDNLGFHLHRGHSASGPWMRITPSLVPGLGSSPLGASYSWLDTGLTNGVRYYYRLEAVDTRSVSTFHGPVNTVPSAPGEDGDGDGGADGTERVGSTSCPSWILSAAADTPSPTCTRHGDPDSVSLQVLARDSSSATLDLHTGGFWTLEDGSGTVRVFVPGLEFPSDPRAPALPLRRALVEAVVGKGVELVSAEAFRLRPFPALRPSAVGVAEMAVGRDGTVRPARRALSAPVPSRGYLPSEVARLAGTVFQGERKSAVVEITPVRFSGRGLVLAETVRVRLAFTGVEERESSPGSRRRAVPRHRGPFREILAQLHTTSRGVHAVRFEQLFPQRGRGFSTAFLRLQRQGEAVAFHVEPPGTVFGPGSVLYFFADRTASSTDYTSEVAYELVRAPGERMGVAIAAPQAEPVLTSSVAFASFETNRIYQPGLLEAADVWLWEAMGSGVTRTEPFPLVGVATSSGETARLVVHLQGGSESGRAAEHHVRLSLNGAEVGEATFSGKRAQRVQVALPVSQVREGENELAVTNAGDAGVASLVFLDRFEVSYPQASTARGGVFEGVWGEGGTVEVGGLTGVPVILRESGQPGLEGSTVTWVTGFQATGSSVRFEAEAGHQYVVVSPEGLRTPRVAPVALSTLRERSNQADYVLIAPGEFLEAARPLVERRREQGLASRAVAFEEIASQFGHGQPSAEAIREFLAYTYHSWQPPSPRYVLLLGDATVDPRRFVATSGPSPLPALWTKTSYLWTVSDPALAAVNGEDLVPDLAIGRLPAGTVEEAERLVTKLLAWEETGQGLSGHAVLVADNPDLGGDFEWDVEDIRASLLSGRSTSTLRVRELGAATKGAILGAFDEGASLMSYVGHGGTAVWASENVLNTWDVPSLRAQSRQPLLLTPTCLNGYFVTPNLDALPEALLKAAGRGVIGAFSPSGLSLDGPAHQYHRAVMAELASGEHVRLGDAILAAQRTYAETGLMPELLAVYHLLGDPATSIR